MLVGEATAADAADVFRVSNQFCVPPNKLEEAMNEYENDKYLIIKDKSTDKEWINIYAVMKRTFDGGGYAVMGNADGRKCCVTSVNGDITLDEMLTHTANYTTKKPSITGAAEDGRVAYYYDTISEVKLSVTYEKYKGKDNIQLCRLTLDDKAKNFVVAKTNNKRFDSNADCESKFATIGINKKATLQLCYPYWGSENSSNSSLFKCKVEAKQKGLSFDELCWAVDPNKEDRREEMFVKAYSLYLMAKQNMATRDKINSMATVQ